MEGAGWRIVAFAVVVVTLACIAFFSGSDDNDSGSVGTPTAIVATANSNQSGSE